MKKLLIILFLISSIGLLKSDGLQAKVQQETAGQRGLLLPAVQQFVTVDQLKNVLQWQEGAAGGTVLRMQSTSSGNCICWCDKAGNEYCDGDPPCTSCKPAGPGDDGPTQVE